MTRLLLNGYVVAILATLLLTTVLKLLQPIFGGTPPVLLPLVGVMLAAWYGGFRAGLLATVLSALASTYFLVEPYYSLKITRESEQLRLLLFAGVGGVLSLMIAYLRRTERQALREALQQKERLEQEMATRVQAERALRAAHSEAVTAKSRLEAMMEALPVGVAIIDAQGGLLQSNRAFDQIWGGPQPVAQSVSDYAAYQAWWVDTGRLVQPEEWAAAQAVQQGKTVVGQWLEITRFDGTRALVHNSAAPILNGSGQIVGSAVALMDVTAQLKNEAALRESEERYRLAIEAAQLGTWDWDLASNQVVSNPGHAAIFGYPPQDRPRDYQDYASRVHPEDWPRVEAALAEAKQRHIRYGLDYRLVWPDGTLRWVSALGDFQYDPEGHPVRMIGVVMDITERKRAEELGQAHRQLLETVVNHLPAAVNIIRGHDLRVQLINPAYQAIAPGKAMVGKTLDELWPETGQCFEALCCRVLSTGEPYQVVDELNMIRRSPEGPLEPAYFSWSLFRVRLPGDEGWGILNTAWETTERKQAEEALREADQRKTEFLAMLGHELRNPLAPIRNAIQVMKKVPPASPKHHWAQQVIERQMSHLVRLVDDLLDVSRIIQGKIVLQKAPLDLAAVLQQAIETSHPLIQARHHKLHVVWPDPPLQLEGDGLRLAQVIANLLNNAAKYTPEGGTIWLEATGERDEAVIRVRDTGEGLSPALLPHLFNLFTQAERTLDRAQGGLGIGLTIVKTLVELHGGRVEARSEGPGQGSEFVVRLPLHASSLAMTL